MQNKGNCPNCPTGVKGANGTQEKCQNTETAGARLDIWHDSYDVMKTFHISQRTLQTLRSNGKLPYAKLGNKCFYREQDLQQMMMESFRDSRVKSYDQETPDLKKGGGSWQ